MKPILLALLLLAPVCSLAQVNKCVSTSGAVSYSDRPCVGGKTSVIAAKSTCPTRRPGSEKNWGRTFVLPAERKTLACEIAGARREIAKHKETIAQTTSPAMLALLGGDSAGRTALDNKYFYTRALLSEEERYLAELERQLNPGPVRPENSSKPTPLPGVGRHQKPYVAPHVESQK